MANTATLITQCDEQPNTYLLQTEPGKDLGINCSAALSGVLFVYAGRNLKYGDGKIYEISFSHDGASGNMLLLGAISKTLTATDRCWLVGALVVKNVPVDITFSSGATTFPLISLVANQGFVYPVQQSGNA